MAADLYLIEPAPAEGAAGAAGAAAAARPGAERIVTAGIRVALVAAAIQAVVHFVNAATAATPHLDVNAEHNVFSWAHSSAILAAAVAALAAVLVEPRRRRPLLALAACATFISVDETVVLHENLAFAILGVLGLPDVYDSILWPLLYLPLLLTTAVLLVLVSETAPPPGRRIVRAGLALLAAAVVLEILSTPWSNDHNLIHTIEGGLEESAELVGWILIATGIGSLALGPHERRARIRRVSRS